MGLLLDTDIDETLSCLPSTLNETYDSILRRIQKPSHQELAKIALRWIAVAQQPLLVEELIEACTVKLEAGGQVCEGSRLSPAQIVMLLRHLVVLEKTGDETDEGLASTAACNKDSIVFAHFSVREYLATPKHMSPAIRPIFAIEFMQAHLYVASSCVAYLSQTNTLGNRQKAFPLRSYAWDLWALHAVSSTTDTANCAIEISKHAQDLCERVAFGSGYDIPGSLQPIVWWATSKQAVLDCLRNPYFFEEYSDGGLNLDNLNSTAHGFEHQYYRPLNIMAQEIRLLHIVPNRHSFASIRCSLLHASLDARLGYEAISYVMGDPGARKYIWLNGSRFNIFGNCQASLRATRKSILRGQLVWIDAICIDQHNLRERVDQIDLMSSIYASAISVSIILEDASEDEVWALEIIRLIVQLLETHSDNLITDLSNLLRSRRSTDPFVCLFSLFQRSWWGRSWVLQEAVLGKNPVLLYGVHALPLASVQNFVGLADLAFQLIRSASPNSDYDPAVLENTVQWKNVLGLVRMRAQHQCGIKPRSITQLLYASRYLAQFDLRDRFYSLSALMPSGAPSQDYELTRTEVCIDFCSYVMLLTRNLDIYTLYFPEKPDRHTSWAGSSLEREMPSWADPCVSCASMDIMRPLLYQELVTGADGAFCAGSCEFREAPAIDRRERTLHLEGFPIDSIDATHSHPSDIQDDQARLDHKGYGEFSRRGRWFRTTGGLAVLGPAQAQAGSLLTILLGGKTPYLLERVHDDLNHFRLVGEWYVISPRFPDVQDKRLTSIAMSTV
jgi:hypothetical protein